jgi:hypothetical protein
MLVFSMNYANTLGIFMHKPLFLQRLLRFRGPTNVVFFMIYVNMLENTMFFACFRARLRMCGVGLGMVWERLVSILCMFRFAEAIWTYPKPCAAAIPACGPMYMLQASYDFVFLCVFLFSFFLSLSFFVFLFLLGGGN